VFRRDMRGGGIETQEANERKRLERESVCVEEGRVVGRTGRGRRGKAVCGVWCVRERMTVGSVLKLSLGTVRQLSAIVVCGV